jgi:DNA invertase Pin-like site-specific DNA recombinase
MTAYAYMRKSSVRDPAREVSHEVQEGAVGRMAAEHGDLPLTILSDWDKSGRLGADKRPGYRALLDAIESGRATSVYSYSLSRLGRSVAELARLIDDCSARGIPVRLYADHVDTSTASGRLLTNVLGSVAQFEADVASERVRAANSAKLARGESLSTVPFYGDAEGEDGPAILEAFREAGSFSAAAKLLNERGVKPRTSTRGWWPSAVAVVCKRLDPSIGHRGGGRGVGAGGSDFILARLLRCPTCGTRLTGTRDRGTRVRYSCRLGTSLPHQRISVTEHLILPAIRAEVDRLRTPDQVEAATGAEAARAELEGRRARIIDLFEAGHVDRQDRERRLAAVNDELAQIDARQVVLAVPAVDWTWEPRPLNRVLRAILDGIELDVATFQPKPDGYVWTVPEWRSAD